MRVKGDRSEYNESQELENLQRVFHQLDKKADKKIDPEELADYLAKLGYKCRKADVEDMIWEVDEDCDRAINWEEFKSMFYRVRHDKTGWEPRRLFNVIEFMMHDKARAEPDALAAVASRGPAQPRLTPRPPRPPRSRPQDQSGTIDMDECMEILFRRFGKEQLEEKVNEFLANDEDGDREISFTEFLNIDRNKDSASTSKHPGFRLSAGMLQTTKQENERLVKQIQGARGVSS